jgi:hypothetical protein
MKKIFFLLVIATILSVNTIVAQEEQTFTEMFDSVFQHVSRTDATTGILYNRVFPLSGMYRFTQTDTANSDIFMHAYQELYDACFEKNILRVLKYRYILLFLQKISYARYTM